jgi:hypothetical protein
MPLIIIGGSLFDCFVCKCEAVVLALSIFSVDYFSKGPNRVGIFTLQLRMETDPISKTSCSSFLIPDDGQSPEPQ